MLGDFFACLVSDRINVTLKTLLSVAEFQKKLQAAPFWASSGCAEDKQRLLEDNSVWCQNFMKWAEKEADVLSLIEKTMKWRAEVEIYNWNTSQAGFLPDTTSSVSNRLTERARPRSS